MRLRPIPSYPAVLLAGLAALTAVSCSDGNTDRAGLWLLPRMDPSNQARADIRGGMIRAPEEIWRTSTGADISYAASVVVDNHDAILVQAGKTLALCKWDGAVLWRLDKHAVRQVVHIGDFDGDERDEALVFRGNREISLVGLASGALLWNWTSPPSSNNVLCRFVKAGKGIRLITFPNYSCLGICFDFSGGAQNPRVVWGKDYSAKYTKGYGPSFILADMDGDEDEEILLSSKHEGRSDGKSLYQAVIDPETGEIVRDGCVRPDPDAPLPLGRPYGFLQAEDLDGDGLREIVLASCQVEEYIAVTRQDRKSGIEMLWAQFIEKDWPEDDRELRPQVTSLSDVDGDERKELVVGLWDKGSWTTLILDPVKGFDAPRAALQGRYFWGCHDLDGDGAAEIVAGRESRRQPARITRLEAVSGKTLRAVAELENAAVLGSADSDIGQDVHFMAIRNNPVQVRSADGRQGILVRKFRDGRAEGVFIWGNDGTGKGKQTIEPFPLAGGLFDRVDYHGGKLLRSTREGEIQGLGEELTAAGGRIRASGRLASPLLWSVGGRRELVFDEAGGSITGGVPALPKHDEKKEPTLGNAGIVNTGDASELLAAGCEEQGSKEAVGTAGGRTFTSAPSDGKRGRNAEEMESVIPARAPDGTPCPKWESRWRISGALPVLHIDRKGRGRIAAADFSDSDHPAALIYGAPVREDRAPLRIPLEHPPFIGLLPHGDEFRLLVNLKTGVHTNAFACYNARGDLTWEDRGHGAYPRLPAAGDLDGDGIPEVIADDHGELRIYNERGSVVGSGINEVWTPPAYLLPILGPFLPDGKTGILGISGFGGMTLHDSKGAIAWKKRGGDWEYYRSLGAVGILGDSNKPCLGVLTEAGEFQCLEVSTGSVLWTLGLGCNADETSVVAGDLDGDGLDEFLAGLPDGRLVCIGEKDGRGAIEWVKTLDTAIGPVIIADVDDDGKAEVILSTADGLIRILK